MKRIIIELRKQAAAAVCCSFACIALCIPQAAMGEAAPSKAAPVTSTPAPAPAPVDTMDTDVVYVTASQLTTTQAPPLQLASAPARIGPEMTLMIGKSTILRLPDAIDRVSVGNPLIADVTPVSSRELYLLGKDLGTTNVIVWAKGGQATAIDVKVMADPSVLEAELATLLPGERDLRVKTA